MQVLSRGRKESLDSQPSPTVEQKNPNPVDNAFLAAKNLISNSVLNSSAAPSRARGSHKWTIVRRNTDLGDIKTSKPNMTFFSRSRI